MHPGALEAVLQAAGRQNRGFYWKWSDAARQLDTLSKHLVSIPQLLELVLKAAGDQKKSSPFQRWGAIAALGQIGERLVAYPEALTALMKPVDVEGPKGRQIIIWALGNLGTSPVMS